MDWMQQVDELIGSQLRDWPLAARNYGALAKVMVKSVRIGETTINVQFNPERIVSSAAKVDAKSLSERPCFLCAHNLPVEQKSIAWGNGYQILVNPFPIFPKHLTIPSIDHIPQRIEGRVLDMLGLAADLKGFTLFYNGPLCGASAPDHFHFQAGQKGHMPFEQYLTEGANSVLVKCRNGGEVLSWPNLPWGVATFVGDDKLAVAEMFAAFYDGLKGLASNHDEPMLNLLALYHDGRYHLHLFPRAKHRPSHFFKETDNVVMSPASVDMAGLWVTARQEDFDRMDALLVRDIAAEVCWPSSKVLHQLETIFQ